MPRCGHPLTLCKLDYCHEVTWPELHRKGRMPVRVLRGIPSSLDPQQAGVNLRLLRGLRRRWGRGRRGRSHPHVPALTSPGCAAQYPRVLQPARLGPGPGALSHGDTQQGLCRLGQSLPHSLLPSLPPSRLSPRSCHTRSLQKWHLWHLEPFPGAEAELWEKPAEMLPCLLHLCTAQAPQDSRSQSKRWPRTLCACSTWE